MVKITPFVALGLAVCTAASVTGNTAKPKYKDTSAPLEERVSDLLSRMTIEEKTAQLIQGDVSNWLNTTTGAFNRSGLVDNMKTKAGSFYGEREFEYICKN